MSSNQTGQGQEELDAAELTRRLTERYDRVAPNYRDLWAPVLRKAGQVLVHELASVPAKRVLDVGTGVGALLPDLRAAFPDAGILGIDRSLGMLSLADGTACRAVMDAGRLGLKSSSMDVMLMVFMLFHLESPALGLREARRLLRDGGRLGVVTWGGEFESKATMVWTECLDEFVGAPEPATSTNDAFDTPEKMEVLLRSAGYARANSWMEELEYAIELEHLLRLRTTVGSQRPRFESLDAALQLECLTQARRKLNQLAQEDFVAHGNIVYSVGHA